MTGGWLTDEVRDIFVPFTAQYEGTVPWLYLDVLGLVTVAIGVLVDPMWLATSLPFVDKDTGAPAGQVEIADEWMRIKNHKELAQKGHRAAQSLCQLRLTTDGVHRVVVRKLDQMAEHLGRRFPGIALWPVAAKIAVLSVSWACGPGFRFPKLEAALLASDFATAAEECEINTAGNPGVVPRNAANKALLLEAARLVPLEHVDAPPELSDEERARTLALVAMTLASSVSAAIEMGRDDGNEAVA